MTIVIAIAAIAISILTIAFNLGWLNRWIVFYNPLPRPYWRSAFRRWREHREWPI